MKTIRIPVVHRVRVSALTDFERAHLAKLENLRVAAVCRHVSALEALRRFKTTLAGRPQVRKEVQIGEVVADGVQDPVAMIRGFPVPFDQLPKILQAKVIRAIRKESGKPLVDLRQATP